MISQWLPRQKHWDETTGKLNINQCVSSIIYFPRKITVEVVVVVWWLMTLFGSFNPVIFSWWMCVFQFSWLLLFSAVICDRIIFSFTWFTILHLFRIWLRLLAPFAHNYWILGSFLNLTLNAIIFIPQKVEGLRSQTKYRNELLKSSPT